MASKAVKSALDLLKEEKDQGELESYWVVGVIMYILKKDLKYCKKL
jgi:hypothetical protein